MTIAKADFIESMASRCVGIADGSGPERMVVLTLLLEAARELRALL